MAVPVFSEQKVIGDWLKSETHSPFEFSRDNVTLLSNGSTVQALLSGTILGKVTASGKFVILAPGASDGSQTAVAVLCFDVSVPATGDLVAPAITRDAIVSDTQVVFPGGASSPQKVTAITNLALVGIIARRTV